jgi:hypothetical protein
MTESYDPLTIKDASLEIAREFTTSTCPLNTRVTENSAMSQMRIDKSHPEETR